MKIFYIVSGFIIGFISGALYSGAHPEYVGRFLRRAGHCVHSVSSRVSSTGEIWLRGEHASDSGI